MHILLYVATCTLRKEQVRDNPLLTLQHATRVLRILRLDDLIEDIVFCDYAVPGFSCKPEPEYYQQVL